MGKVPLRRATRSTEPNEEVHTEESMITVKRRDRSLTRNVSLFKRIPDTVARGSADIDHVEEQSDLTPVPVPHHAGEHQAYVDAPTVTPVTIVQSKQCDYRL